MSLALLEVIPGLIIMRTTGATRMDITAPITTGTTAPTKVRLTAFMRVDTTVLIFMAAVITQAVITMATITGQVTTPMTVRFLSTLSRFRLPHFHFHFFQFQYRAIDK